MLLVLNLPLIPAWVALLRIPYALLNTFIMAFMMVGAYSVNNSLPDVGLMIVFGALGWIFKKLDFPLAPVALSFILCPMMEKSLYRSLTMSQGEMSIFITRPISVAFLVLTLVVLIFFSYKKKAQTARTQTDT